MKALECSENYVLRGHEVKEKDSWWWAQLGFQHLVAPCWNTKSLVSNLMALLWFERAEKGKATAFKGTSALIRGGKIHIFLGRHLTSTRGTSGIFQAPSEQQHWQFCWPMSSVVLKHHCALLVGQGISCLRPGQALTTDWIVSCTSPNSKQGVFCKVRAYV